MVDRKVNNYFIHKKTGEIYWNNAAWKVNFHPAALILACGLCYETRMELRSVEPDDYFIIPGYAIEMLIYISEYLEECQEQNDTHGFGILDQIDSKIHGDFHDSCFDAHSLNEIKKHYKSMESK